jgi:MFS family permease
MRRLVLMLSAVVAVDTMFYTALAPLLPHFATTYGLGKGGAGVLAALYAAGVLLASIPGGMAASRLGPKKGVLLGVALTALASLAFGLASDKWMLGGARLAQGIGSAFSWAGALAWLVATAPPQRRGTAIGTTMGAAVFGALLGPVVGAIATLAGVRPTFIGVSVAGFALLAWIASRPGVRAHPQPLSALRRADVRLYGALWLLVLPAFLFGVLDVLAPLHLHAEGWGGVAIGAVFLVAAAFETAMNPLLGRFTDRHGRTLPIRLALLGSIVVSLALAAASAPAFVAALLMVASLVYGAFFTPAMALVSDSADRNGIVFGVMNGAWALGNVVGPAAGGALAQSVSDAFSYLLMAGICLATLAVATTYSQPRLRPSSS